MRGCIGDEKHRGCGHHYKCKNCEIYGFTSQGTGDFDGKIERVKFCITECKFEIKLFQIYEKMSSSKYLRISSREKMTPHWFILKKIVESVDEFFTKEW